MRFTVVFKGRPLLWPAETKKPHRSRRLLVRCLSRFCERVGTPTAVQVTSRLHDKSTGRIQPFRVANEGTTTTYILIPRVWAIVLTMQELMSPSCRVPKDWPYREEPRGDRCHIRTIVQMSEVVTIGVQCGTLDFFS
jgi:hypothetical protein